jgi:hypothetical protein
MTALLHDDVAPPVPAVPAPGSTPRQARRLRRPAGGDPLVEAAARLLSIPLRHMYAVLWRVGLIEVTA